MPDREVIVIVGGGSVGVSCLVQLTNEAIKNQIASHVEIVMFDPLNTVGPGYAYQSDYACNLLNTRADTMSAIESDRRDFLNWAEQNKDAWAPDYPGLTVTEDAFLPRSLFGRYLADTFTKYVAKARLAGIQFQHIKDKVVDIVPCHDGSYYVDTANTGAFHANRIVLCSGNLESTNFPDLVGEKNFYNNPYPGEKFAETVPQNASVCILGTNLSAIDTVMSLIEGGHKGKIVCASRNGRLPSVRGVLNKPITLKELTRRRIDEIMEQNGGGLLLSDVAFLLKSEYEQCTGTRLDIESIMNRATGTYDYLNSEIELSATQERFWQSVIYATNPIIDYIWHKLDLVEKRIFQTAIKALWFSYRVSFPLQNARRIRDYMRTERVSVFGGFTSIQKRANDDAFDLKIVDKKTAFRSTIECDVVINATSYSTDVAQAQDPLIKNLLRRRLAMPNEFGGFELDFDTGRLVGSDNRVNRSISVLGSLATGVYFWTNAMDVNARLAASQASRIASEIAGQSIRTLNRSPTEAGAKGQAIGFNVPEERMTA